MFAKIAEVSEGINLITDAGFTCMADHEEKIVQKDDGGLFVSCKDGKHYLSGQHTEGGHISGLTLADR